MSEEEKAALREKESQARHDQHVKEHTLAAERHQVDSQRRALGLNSADAAQEVYECEWGCGFESSVVMEVAEHEKHCSLRPQEAVVTLQSGGQGWLQPSERQKEIEVFFFFPSQPHCRAPPPSLIPPAHMVGSERAARGGHRGGGGPSGEREGCAPLSGTLSGKTSDTGADGEGPKRRHHGGEPPPCLRV